MDKKLTFTVGVIIISDRAFSGERKDACLPVFQSTLPKNIFKIKETTIISDDPQMIESTLNSFIQKKYDLIFTSGGTGCAPRDNTPDVTSKLINQPTLGVDEAIRVFSQTKSPNAIFSRAVSGVAKQSFIINLPGSPKAVKEILTFLLPVIEHPLKLIANQIDDCCKENINDKL